MTITAFTLIASIAKKIELAWKYFTSVSLAFKLSNQGS